MVGYNYQRSTSHGAQNLHRGEDVVPTGPDHPGAVHPHGVIGAPVTALAACRLVRTYSPVGGYHNAALFELLEHPYDFLIGHILPPSRGGVQLPAGRVARAGEPIVLMGDRCTADPGNRCSVDAHIHVQVAHRKDRARYVNVLGSAFNAVAVDPREVRLMLGEPDMPHVPYHGPFGPAQVRQADHAAQLEGFGCGGFEGLAPDRRSRSW